MGCFYTTGIACLLSQPKRPDLFEVHVTIQASNAEEIKLFQEICHLQHWKAILIDFGPAIAYQPMTCTRVTGELAQVYQHALAIQSRLQESGLSVIRIKIEAAPWNRYTPVQTSDSKPHAEAYFEYHAKLQLPNQPLPARLIALCANFNAHLSRNSLKSSTNGWIERFTTIRDYQRGLIEFQHYTEQFQAALEQANIPVLKTVIEYCLYDSNSELDQAWLQANLTADQVK